MPDQVSSLATHHVPPCPPAAPTCWPSVRSWMCNCVPLWDLALSLPSSGQPEFPDFSCCILAVLHISPQPSLTSHANPTGIVFLLPEFYFLHPMDYCLKPSYSFCLTAPKLDCLLHQCRDVIWGLQTLGWFLAHNKCSKTILWLHHFAGKGSYSQSYGFSSTHVWMWELDHKEGWAVKNWGFRNVVLEKTLESPLDCKEMKPDNPKGNQYSLEELMLKLKLQYFGCLMRRADSLEKTLVLGKVEGRRRRGWQDEMAGWHHQLNAHEFE